MAVSAQQLTAARTSAASTFDRTCRVKRTTKTRDAQSGRTETTALSDDIDCRIGRMSAASEGVYAQQMRGRRGLVVSMDPDITMNDVPIGSPDRLVLDDGRVVEVLGTNVSHSLQTEQRVYCVETR